MARQRRDAIRPNAQGLFFRQIGYTAQTDGKMIQPKFLLGRDRGQAESAYQLLGELWGMIEKQNTQDNDRTLFMRSPSMAPTKPHWSEESLMVARAIARGQRRIPVDRGLLNDLEYAFQMARLNDTYPWVLFIASDETSHIAGKQQWQHITQDRVRKAEQAAKIAHVPIPTTCEQTLHQSIDQFAEHIANKHDHSAYGRRVAGDAIRLKGSTPDMTVDHFDFNAIEHMTQFWARRPVSNRHGNEKKCDRISVHTVNDQIKTLRMFVRWMHRNSSFKWDMPRDADEAMKINLQRLRTDDELAKVAHGPQTYTVRELTTLYRHATDYERALLLLGLNFGFAQAEVCTLRKDEIYRDGQPSRIKRIRRKSKVYVEIAIWSETQLALDWLNRDGDTPPHPRLAVTTRTGQPLNSHRIANVWNRLIERVCKSEPGFRCLSYKFLRKTAGQFVRELSDGETAGVFLAHGKPVTTDGLLDDYTRRIFARVFDANRLVHAILQPMFAEAPSAFTQPRRTVQRKSPTPEICSPAAAA